MKFKYSVSVLLVALLSVGAIPTFSPLSMVKTVLAQATTTQTTAGAAITASQTVIPVASATGLARGYTLVIDGEAMTIAGSYVAASTQVPVVRGQFGTVAGAHASGAVVFAGPPNYFSETDPVGPCTSSNEIALPRVVLGTVGSQPGSVSVYNCQGASSTTQRWQRYTVNGYPTFAFASPGGTQAGVAPPTYTTAGALTVMPGVQYIGSAGALAMTLAAPSVYQSGMVMVLQASTAQAHTVTYTAGFYGNTTSSDVCTFGGAIGDNLIIYAQNGAWRVLSNAQLHDRVVLPVAVGPLETRPHRLFTFSKDEYGERD